MAHNTTCPIFQKPLSTTLYRVNTNSGVVECQYVGAPSWIRSAMSLAELNENILSNVLVEVAA